MSTTTVNRCAGHPHSMDMSCAACLAAARQISDKLRRTTQINAPLVSAREQFGIEAAWMEEAARDLDQDQPLDALVSINRAAKQLATMQAYAVQVARTQGKSWESIAQVLGMTRQGAQQRFGLPTRRL